MAQNREGSVRDQRNQCQQRRQGSAWDMIYSLKSYKPGSESQTPSHAVSVDSPARPPLANVIVSRYE